MAQNGKIPENRGIDLFSNYMDVREKLDKILDIIESMNLVEKVDTINYIKEKLHDVSPFYNQPVDCVVWVKSYKVKANNYNPNTVAPPEMRLLEHSILHDGYTQPIVTMLNEAEYETIDGFHRGKAGKENKKINSMVYGYLPVTLIQNKNTDIKDRMAATIRHNRARGKHGVKPMIELIRDLFSNGWKDDEIGKELGMDADEVLRFRIKLGLPNMMKDKPYSKSWE